MKSDKKEIGRLISGMRSAYARNENVMAWARDNSAGTDNTIVSTLNRHHGIQHGERFWRIILERWLAM